MKSIDASGSTTRQHVLLMGGMSLWVCQANNTAPGAHLHGLALPRIPDLALAGAVPCPIPRACRPGPDRRTHAQQLSGHAACAQACHVHAHAPTDTNTCTHRHTCIRMSLPKTPSSARVPGKAEHSLATARANGNKPPAGEDVRQTAQYWTCALGTPLLLGLGGALGASLDALVARRERLQVRGVRAVLPRAAMSSARAMSVHC